MTTERYMVEIGGMPVEVVRKGIKNLHLSIYPPNGRVRVAVPKRLDDEAVRLAVITRLGWIRQKQTAFELQDRQSQREMVTGESHYFQGRRYRLDVIEHDGSVTISTPNRRTLRLHIRSGSTRTQRERALNLWYRETLRNQIHVLLPKWEGVVQVKPLNWGIKRMKTKWGSCNIAAKRIWLNLELAKKPPECLEYILVHELVHLHERNHNERFHELMSRYMPQWPTHRERLNQAPLAHEDWTY